MGDISNFFDRIKHKWEKPIGLIVVCLLFLFFYFTFIVEQLKILNLNSKGTTYYFITPLAILLLIYGFWLVSTKRLNWLKTKKITVGIFIKIDEEESEIKFKKLIKETISELNTKFDNISLRLYPINSVKTTKELLKYYSKKGHVLDAIIFAEVESGKRTRDNVAEDIIEIVNITFQGNFDVNRDFKLFKTSLNISKDVKIRNIDKNWAYIEGNSLADKRKIKNNFEDTILFYCGLYLIYQNNLEDALTLLKTLQNSKNSSINIIKNEEEIIVNSNFISAARLNDILLNLFVINSSKSYNNKKTKEAYDILKDCEDTFGSHSQSYGHYIQLSRLSYELGLISDAKAYTTKARNLKHYGTEIYLNLGFFGIIDNNEDDVYNNYKELSKVYRREKSTMSFTEIASWLENQKKHLTNRKELLEFAIGTINFFYSDKKLGKKILTESLDNELYLKHPKIHELTKIFITKGAIKSVYHRKYQNGSKKKKRRK